MAPSERLLHVLESDASASAPKQKSNPKSSDIPSLFQYSSSQDGRDENLLIVLHGLGDTYQPFFKLGYQFKLPKTAVLALSASLKIPYLEEAGFQWYSSFDQLGELIEQPNPTPALELLSKTMRHLTKDCGWQSHQVHFFGFSQGGTVALEFGLQWERLGNGRLGSIVSVNGPLISYPTPSKLGETPVLITYRPAKDQVQAQSIAGLRKGYKQVEEKKFEGRSPMPASKEQWEPIMKFWSENLIERQDKDMYEVLNQE